MQGTLHQAERMTVKQQQVGTEYLPPIYTELASQFLRLAEDS